MDNGLLLAIATLALVVGAIVFWNVLKRRLPPEDAAELARWIAAIKAQAGTVFDAELISALAGAAYDAWATGSKYYTREQFINLVLRVLDVQPETAALLSATAASLDVLPTTKKPTIRMTREA